MKRVGTLDYEPLELRMFYENETEETKRLGACQKENETCAWIESFKPESVFYDVGACVGSYTLIAAALGHKVVAFEASTPNFKRLAQNMDLNHLGAFLIPDPLWSKQEEVEFCYSSREPGAALHRVNGQSPDREMKQAYPLDWWVFPPQEDRGHLPLPQPRYIKLDVDGVELEVLKGAHKTLRGVESILVETDTKEPSHRHIRPLLEDWGFSLESVHPHGQSSVSNVVFSRHGLRSG